MVVQLVIVFGVCSGLANGRYDIQVHIEPCTMVDDEPSTVSLGFVAGMKLIVEEILLEHIPSKPKFTGSFQK